MFANVPQFLFSLRIIFVTVFQDKRHALSMGGTPDPDIPQNPINDDLKAKRIGRNRTTRGVPDAL